MADGGGAGRALRPPRRLRRACTCTSPWRRWRPTASCSRAPLPMVGTYHRAGVSRWVRPLQPLAELVGRRMQVRVAVSEAARETGLRCGRGRLRGAVQRGRHGPLRVGPAASGPRGPSGRAVPRPPRAAQGPAGPPRRLRHAGAAGRPVGGRRRAGHRGAAPPAPGVGPGALAGRAERRGGGVPAGRGRRAVRARRCRASPSAWCSSRGWRPGAPWWPPTSRATARRRAATPRWCRPATPAPWPAPSTPRWPTRPTEPVGDRGPQGGDRVRPGLVDGHPGRALRRVYGRAIEAYRAGR